MRKFASLLAVLLAVVMVLGACSAGGTSTSTAPSTSTSTAPATSTSTAEPSSDNPIDALEAPSGVDMEFWHIQATIYGEAIQEIVKDFNSKWDIKVTEVYQGDYTTLNQKVMAALQGGGLPVVAMANENPAVEYMKAGITVPLNQYINSEKWGLTAEEIAAMNPGVLARQQLPIYNGETYSWPHGNSACGLYVNLDMLKEAGVDANIVTWEEFEAAVNTVYEKTGNPTAVRTAIIIDYWTPYVWSAGYFPVARDGKSVDFNNEGVIGAWEMFLRMMDKGSMVSVDDSETEFVSGRSPFEMGTTARTSTKVELIAGDFEWDMINIPQVSTDKSTWITCLWGGNQVLFDHGDDEKNLAGWIFMREFAGPEYQAIYAARTGYFPATTAAAEIEVLAKDYTANPQKQHAFERVFTYAQIDSVSPISAQVRDLINTTGAAVFNHEMTPEQAAAFMQGEAEAYMAQFGNK